MPRFKSPYPNIREVFGAEYRRLPPERIEALLESANIVAEDLEGFLDDLKKIGQGVVSALPSIIPGVTTALGTAIGGPVGGALGAAAGQAAATALGPSPPKPAPTPSMPGPQPTPPQVQGPPPAAGQLLRGMFDPAALQALIAMLMGQAGPQTIPVGAAKTPVRLGEFTNMLGVLANRASAEHNATVATKGEAIPRYLFEYAGEVPIDPAVPEHRAEVLLEMLREAAFEQDEAYNEDSQRQDEQFYDELDLAQLYSGYEL